MRSSRPIRACRTATTGSRPAGSASTGFRSGTATQPLPTRDDRLVRWDEATRTVADAYAAFDPRLAELAAPFFDRGWIDAAVKPGKAPGAFAHPTVTDVHPFVMLNYLGKPRDVMTLAHELGHGVHQVLAAGQGELLSSTPLTLARRRACSARC
jgi:oligoendopeptidase F